MDIDLPEPERKAAKAKSAPQFKAKKYSEDKCNQLLHQWSLTLTGAFGPDCFLKGIGSAAGTVVQLVLADEKSIIPPQKREVEALRQHPSVWNKYLVKLGSIAFFADMTIEAREAWLQNTADAKESSIGSQAGVLLKFIELGKAFNEKLTSDQQRTLLDGQARPAAEVEAMFPRKPGSSARLATLILFRHNWQMATLFSLVAKTKQLTFDVVSGQVSTEYVATPTQSIWQMSLCKWAFAAPKPTGVDLALKPLLLEKYRLGEGVYDAIDFQLREMTPGYLKSLIQKLIRFQPQQVALFGAAAESELVDSSNVLVVALKCLFEHAGSFVPDIGRFVTGVEGMCKRLAVIAFEDSYVAPQQYPVLVSLLASALLNQSVRQWRPTSGMFLGWCDFAVGLLEQRQAFSYATAKMPAVSLSATLTPLQTCSALLDLLKSFAGDLNMVRHIAHHQGLRTVSPPPEWSRPAVMPLWHMMDQHCCTAVAWYYPTEVCVPGENYANLFQRLFREVTGVNPRRESVDGFEARSFVQLTRAAQAQVFFETFGAPFNWWTLRQVQPETPQVQFAWELDDSVLSALCGPIEVKLGAQTYFGILDANEPENIVVMKRPSRETTDAPISAKIRQQVIDASREQLQLGVRCRQLPPSLRQFEQSRLWYSKVHASYMVDELPWHEARQLNRMVGVCDALELPTWSSGVFPLRLYPDMPLLVSEDAVERLNTALLPATPLPVLRRFLAYVSGFGSEMVMHPISQDGTGQDYAVSVLDSQVVHFARRLCLLYPAALMPKVGKPGTFVSRLPFVLWQLRDTVSQFVCRHEAATKWPVDLVRFPLLFVDDRKYELKPHQQRALDKMVTQYERKKRAQFVWGVPGFGKTLVMLRFGEFIWRQDDLPWRILYAYPREAKDNLENELRHLNVPFADMKMTTGDIPPYQVTLVEHDQLWRQLPRILPIADQLLFVADECHKMMAATLRTSAALQIASLCRLLVAMSGTPIMNSQVYTLIPWQKRIVDFEIIPRNMFTAASAMVHEEFDHGITVNRQNQEVVLANSARTEYFQLVPLALGGQNARPEYRHFAAALQLCYDACYTQMVNEAVARYDQGRRVFLVAKDQAGIDQLYQLLWSSGRVPSADIFRMQNGHMVTLTPAAVALRQVHDFRIVIADIRHSLGYTLTTLDTMFRCPYPSNLSTTIQIEGRLLRLGSPHQQVEIKIFYAGLLQRMLDSHQYAHSVLRSLQSMFE